MFKKKSKGQILEIVAIVGAVLVLGTMVVLIALPFAYFGGTGTQTTTPGNYGIGGGELTYPPNVAPQSIAGCIDNWIQGQPARIPSPLVGKGQAFASAGKDSNINPGLMVAIAGQESKFGTEGKSGPAVFNPFGWGCPPCIAFSSWEDAIATVTKKIRENYFNDNPPRDTIEKIREKWAPSNASNDPNNLNRFWVGGVTNYFNSITAACPALVQK